MSASIIILTIAAIDITIVSQLSKDSKVIDQINASFIVVIIKEYLISDLVNENQLRELC